MQHTNQVYMTCYYQKEHPFRYHNKDLQSLFFDTVKITVPYCQTFLFISEIYTNAVFSFTASVITQKLNPYSVSFQLLLFIIFFIIDYSQ
jgi:hypothetical protein